MDAVLLQQSHVHYLHDVEHFLHLAVVLVLADELLEFVGGDVHLLQESVLQTTLTSNITNNAAVRVVKQCSKIIR